MNEFPNVNVSKLNDIQLVTSVGLAERYAGSTSDSYEYTYCTCDLFARKYWCSHMTDLYQENLDAGEYIGEAPLIVIFKSPPLLVQTTVVPVDEDGLLEVHLHWGGFKKLNPGDYTSKGGISLGYMHEKTQSRGYIRKLFLEWAPSQFYNNKLECNTSWHEGDPAVVAQASTPEKINEADKRQVIRDIYSILDTGKCGQCSEVQPVPF